MARLRNWVEAVLRHEPGNADAHAVAVSSWSRSDLQAVATDLLALRGLLVDAHRKARTVITYQECVLRTSEAEQLLGIRDDEAWRGDVNRLLKRGALLHTDIGLLLPTDVLSSFSQGVVVRGVDGRIQGFEDSALPWDISRRLLDAVTPDPSRDETVRRWYRATVAHLLGHYSLAHANRQLERGRQLFATDADILFDSGCFHEMFAAPRTQGVIRSAVLPAGVTLDVRPMQVHWREAEGFFRRVLAINPGFVEARVHLARVIGLQGHHQEAIGELQQAIAATDDRLLLYYADMFLGDEEQTRGHRDAARSAYQRAAALYPLAQSPHLALSQLARRYGDRARALASIRQVFRVTADQANCDDPLWAYHVSAFWNADELLAGWRALFADQEKR